MSAADVQALLRFLSKDAKVPLATAMSKVKELQNAGLGTAEAISTNSITKVQTVFADEKVAKQVLMAAKRVSKRRGAGDTTSSTPAKRRRGDYNNLEPPSPADIEKALELPDSTASEEELRGVVLHSNRAPLVLAFAVVLLRYTMPEQPLSSQLSLAQAVVSMNSKTKAISIGLEKGNTAEREGWGQGQPVVRVMGREVRVLRRWGYNWKSQPEQGVEHYDAASTKQELKKDDGDLNAVSQEEDSPALWAIDLEQLKDLNGPLTFAAAPGDTKGLPIYQPDGARGYVLRAFHSVGASDTADASTSPKTKRKGAAAQLAEKERNLGMLLRAIDMLCQSWAGVLKDSELDSRAWSWYVKVRPDVEAGVPGWGAKGSIKLSDILELRRKG